jgi:DNA-binding Xre family transcriptional regulator
MSAKIVIRLVGDRVGRMRERGELGELISDADLAKAYLFDRADPDDLVLIAHADLEDLIEDRLAEAAHRRTRDQETIPGAVVQRLVSGENPITVWREHRGMTLRSLADAAGLDPGYLSQLENRKRTGPVTTIRKLAIALKLDLDDLVSP